MTICEIIIYIACIVLFVVGINEIISIIERD